MNKLLPGFSPTSRSHLPSGMTTALASFACSDSRKPSAPRKLLAKYDLTFSMASVPKTAEEVRKGLEAVERSEAGFVVVIAGHSYMNDDLKLPLITDSIRVAAKPGVHLSWETHRADLTESL